MWADVADALVAPATLHLYRSGPAGVALAPHTDTGDVLVLQIDGRKDWDVCAPPPRAPPPPRRSRPSRARARARARAGRARRAGPRPRGGVRRRGRAVGGGARRHLAARALDALARPRLLVVDAPAALDDLACERVTLAPGDMLYLPKGIAHRAAARAEGDDGEAGGAAHLTIGLDREGVQWSDVLALALAPSPAVARNASAAQLARSAARGGRRHAGARARARARRAHEQALALARARAAPLSSRPRMSSRCASVPDVVARGRRRGRSDRAGDRARRVLRPLRQALRRVGRHAARRRRPGSSAASRSALGVASFKRSPAAPRSLARDRTMDDARDAAVRWRRERSTARSRGSRRAHGSMAAAPLARATARPRARALACARLRREPQPRDAASPRRAPTSA